MNSFTCDNLKIMRSVKNQNFKKLTKLLMFLFVISISFSSCVSNRNLRYLSENDMKTVNVKTYKDSEISDYKLKPNDELDINIKSLDDPTTNVFQTLGNQQGASSGYTTPYSASLTAYMIDKNGYIQLPVIGNIFVENKTIPEVISMLQDSLNNILSNPTVTVKLVNRYISVLGEVRNPGHFSYSQERINIYNALSLAGDITTYGDRNNVMLVRNENGNNLNINIDLTSSDILASDYYYLRPNDIIYVKPMRKKFWGLDTFPWSVLLSTISTVILIYTVFGQPTNN
jgi:polysaccharide export outer membrane protein